MTEIISEPADENPDNTDWQRNLFRNTFIGYNLLDININNQTFKKGSRLGINGSFYVVKEDQEIEEWDNTWPDFHDIYVYAKPLPYSATFYFSLTEPDFSPEKNGMYRGTDRAIACGHKMNQSFFVTEYIEKIRNRYQMISLASRGYINADIEGSYIMRANSIYESNGAMRGNSFDQPIEGFLESWPEGAHVYLYAEDLSPMSEYYFSLTAPIRDMIRGGLYHNNNKCLAFGIKADNRFHLINWLQPWNTISTVVGTIWEGNQDTTLTLAPGRYTIILRGGNGGNGGRGGNAFTGANGGLGGLGSQGDVVTQEIIIGTASSVNAQVLVGRHGGNGLDASDVTINYNNIVLPGGGGGGGGLPALFSIPSIDLTIISGAGHGGGGGSGSHRGTATVYTQGSNGQNANGNSVNGGSGGGGGGSRNAESNNIYSLGGVGHNGAGDGGDVYYPPTMWTIFHRSGGDGGVPPDNGNNGIDVTINYWLINGGIGGQGRTIGSRNAGGGGGGGPGNDQSRPGANGGTGGTGATTICGVYRTL
ncbi:MAG: hypothetical protein FWH12_02450 [Treponema sp.]|nr:hypothetical protein [Treponema sp.]